MSRPRSAAVVPAALFVIVVERVDTADHGVSGRVTPAFRVNPKSNPRVLRSTTAMR